MTNNEYPFDLNGIIDNSRRPYYNDESDYNTNSPSYYDDLSRKQRLIQYLAEKVGNYDIEMEKRFKEWDELISKFPENVENLLIEWMEDGTLDKIINENIFGELNNNIDYLKSKITHQPLEFFVNSIHGLDDNDGLTKDRPFKTIGHALRNVPRIVNHDVVINIANGIYVENSFFDEWGRRCAIDTSMFVTGIERNDINAIFPTGREWGINKKGAKISLIGESMEGVRIRGRNPEEVFDVNKHGRTGLKSRLRDLYIQNLTFEYFHTGVTAHEGGAISGYNINIENMSNVTMMAESMQSKIEIGNLNINTDSSYCILSHNGQIGLNDSKIVYNGSASVFECYNSYIQILKTDISSSTAGVGVLNNAGYVNIDKSSLDKLNVTNASGNIVVTDTVIKNVSRGIRNQAGKTVVAGNSNIYNCDYGITVEGGYVSVSSIMSMEGTVQKFNNKYGILVEDGYIDISPYSYSAKGYNLKGAEGLSTNDIFFKKPSPAKNFSNITAVFINSETGWKAGELGSNINQFLSHVKNPDPITETVTLYHALRNVKPLTSFNVQDSVKKLNEIIDCIIANGYASSNFFISVRPIINTNTQEGHDEVVNKFNMFLQKISQLQLMRY